MYLITLSGPQGPINVKPLKNLLTFEDVVKETSLYTDFPLRLRIDSPALILSNNDPKSVEQVGDLPKVESLQVILTDYGCLHNIYGAYLL